MAKNTNLFLNNNIRKRKKKKNIFYILNKEISLVRFHFLILILILILILNFNFISWTMTLKPYHCLIIGVTYSWESTYFFNL